MHRSETKKLLRDVLLRNEWLRIASSQDNGNNCYVEAWHYRGTSDIWRGCRLELAWGAAWMEVRLPRVGDRVLSSRGLSKLEIYLEHELGWRLYSVHDKHGDRLYLTELGTELVISFHPGQVVFNTALPTVDGT